MYYTVKTLAAKNFGEKFAAKDWYKKLWWRMLTCFTNCQSLINNKMKPNDAIPYINEHNKTNSVFSRICLVPHASSVLFDDDEGYMYILCMTVESMIHGYHELYKQTIA